jgi:hypothetical protein
MNLGKLLGVNIFGGRRPTAYREDKRVYLPKFNAAGTPVAAPTPAMASRPAPAAVRPNVASAARTTGGLARLNPFRTTTPAAPVAVRAVQPELSLASVKVIQNDLADADIEVVPVRSRTTTPKEVPLLGADRPARLEFFKDGELTVA